MTTQKQIRQAISTTKPVAKAVELDHLAMPAIFYTFAHNAKHCLAQFNKDLPNE